MKICPVCSTEYLDDVRFCQNDGQTLRAASPAHDLVGQVVADRYHVVKKLGEGGMGQVYLAEHVKMGRKSAIKVMNPSLVHDPDALARFNREAANASRITHTNVCAIYDFGETSEGLVYLAMEFIEGEPLTDVLEREGALPIPRAVGIFVQVADALQAAHDLGIVHRDLKPDNIMLTRGRDGSDVVKVVDFGIAKAVGGDDTQKVTKTGLVVGTPEFMSPEQLSGDAVDGRSDIYSLALVLFKMLTGRLPFEATTVQETMIKRLTDEPLALRAARPDLRFPPGLQETIDAALTRTRVERYQSAVKFANDVASIVGVQRGVGSPASLPPTRADQEQTQLLDAPPPRRRSLVPIIVGAVVVLGGGGAAVAVFGGGSGTGGAVRSDTAKPETVHKRLDTASRRFPPNPAPARTRASGIDPAKAGAMLDALIERPTAVILDSAQLIFDTPGVGVRDRAFAACLLAQAYHSQDEAASALRWAKEGLQLNPNLRSCQAIVQALGEP
ncbi:MAG TPA: serine/threonine-protein kinase [Gemmatimonadales bacterium]|nr:serine/threonine-protein kinase [Gemmatimonadales bacterium]